MTSLLITIFILQLAIHLVNNIGVATLNDLVRALGLAMTSAFLY
jgi:hypothetical protein